MDNLTSIDPQPLIKVPLLTGFRRIWYAVTPEETSFKYTEDVPEYIVEAVPFFLMMIMIEALYLTVVKPKNTSVPDVMDSLSSFGTGVFYQLPLLLGRYIELQVFTWVYNNYHIVDLPWDNPVTWFVAFLGVDHGYYWLHRMAHEVNFMWAGHQVHHSSEYYNLSTATRQSILQRYSGLFFHLPLALVAPPAAFMVHIQFNLLYQFWIHTETIGTLGFLEYIFVTPSQHRVHHGRNRYCIDKNYGGTLSVWDQLYGTFQAEGARVQYGLVHPLNSWDQIYTQFCHWMHILRTAAAADGIMHKLRVFWFGPGWVPGAPRMGNIEDIPDIQAPLPVYGKRPGWPTICYVLVHGVLTLLAYSHAEFIKRMMPFNIAVTSVLYLGWSVASIGYIMEKKSYAPFVELCRCVCYLLLDFYTSGSISCYTLPGICRYTFIASVAYNIVCMAVRSAPKSDKKKQ